LNLRHILWFPAAYYYRDVLAVCRTYCTETGQVSKKHDASWRKTIQRPGRNGIACKSTHAIEPEMNRPLFIAHFQGCDEGKLILRTPSGLALIEFSAKVGVINMDNSPGANIFYHDPSSPPSAYV
jgi:hypothetical protein